MADDRTGSRLLCQSIVIDERFLCGYRLVIDWKIVIVAAFIAIYLAVGVHSVPIVYSVSNDELTLNIPIEDLWESLSKGRKN